MVLGDRALARRQPYPKITDLAIAVGLSLTFDSTLALFGWDGRARPLPKGVTSRRRAGAPDVAPTLC